MMPENNRKKSDRKVDKGNDERRREADKGRKHLRM